MSWGVRVGTTPRVGVSILPNGMHAVGGEGENGGEARDRGERAGCHRHPALSTQLTAAATTTYHSYSYRLAGSRQTVEEKKPCRRPLVHPGATHWLPGIKTSQRRIKTPINADLKTRTRATRRCRLPPHPPPTPPPLPHNYTLRTPSPTPPTPPPTLPQHPTSLHSTSRPKEPFAHKNKRRPPITTAS